MGNLCWMTGRYIQPATFRTVKIGDRFRNTHADANTLVIGQRYNLDIRQCRFLPITGSVAQNGIGSPCHNATKHRAILLRPALK